MVNLDDTSRCPVGPECESCGRLDELAVSTADTSVGLLCVTLCDACEAVEVLPVFSEAEAAIRVVEHGEHVGIDAGGARQLAESAPAAASRAACGGRTA